jgi:homoaconitase/3-isopropylmalate dehydratase large subunit
MTIANMSVEMGAKNGYMEPDEKTLDWLEQRAQRPFEVIAADPDAAYVEEKVYDVSRLEPQVACPHTVDNVKPVSDVVGTRIHQAFLGSCTNGRLEDIAAAAEIVRGKKIHPRVRFLVYPASRTIYREAMANGYLMDLTQAGAVIMNPGCGPCPGASGGVLAAGEVCISSSNRNFRGRMGSTDAEVYLASPASVAAAAVAGEMVDFRNL